MRPEIVVFWVIAALLAFVFVGFGGYIIGACIAGIIKAIDNFIDKTTRYNEKVQDSIRGKSHKEKRGDNPGGVCQDEGAGRDLPESKQHKVRE